MKVNGILLIGSWAACRAYALRNGLSMQDYKWTRAAVLPEFPEGTKALAVIVDTHYSPDLLTVCRKAGIVLTKAEW